MTGSRETDHDVEVAIPLSEDQHVRGAVFHEEDIQLLALADMQPSFS